MLCQASWNYNSGVNSYWHANLALLGLATALSTRLIAQSSQGKVSAGPFQARIGPKLFLAILWHQHQPSYAECLCPTPKGRFHFPWVRLHALRDYYSMAALVDRHANVHLTISLTRVLLRQIEDYVERGFTDRALELTQTSPRGMWPAEGSVSESIGCHFRNHGACWIATDKGVLKRSGDWGYDADNRGAYCRAWRAGSEAPEKCVSIFFRDTELGNAIGFRYGHLDPEAAASDFTYQLKGRFMPAGNDEGIVSVILDGENVWGTYQQAGRPFFEALYSMLG